MATIQSPRPSPTLPREPRRASTNSPRLTRNRGRVAIGVFLVAMLSLAFGVLYSNVGERHPVIGIAEPVQAGTPIEASDLKQVRIASDPGLRPIDYADLDDIVGRLAAVNLIPGSLLTRDHLSTGPAIAPGRAVVGVALTPGQYPPELQLGDRVLVVITPPPSAVGSDVPEAATVEDATVLGISPADDGTATVVSLDVARRDAAAIASAAAAKRVSLVRSGE